MTPLLLALACADAPPTPGEPTPAALAGTWAGVPLTPGQWPGWLPEDAARLEGVETLGDGRRRAHRVAGPRPTPASLGLGEGDSQWEVGERWRARVVPAEGPVRTWEIDLYAEPAYLHGAPIPLAPSGGTVLAQAEPARVEGVLDVGTGGRPFRCLGVGADLSPEGWCLAQLSQMWVETWVEQAAPPQRASE